MERRQRVPDATRRKLALMGALTSYRVSAKIGQMFGWVVDKMTIWQSVQRIGRQIEFLLDEKEDPRAEADGTGVGITGIAKRGKELKVLVQYKEGGGIRVAGLDIGNYNGSWEKLFRKNLKIIVTVQQHRICFVIGLSAYLVYSEQASFAHLQHCWPVTFRGYAPFF